MSARKKSTQHRVVDGYVRLYTLEARGKSFAVMVLKVPLVGTATTYAVAVRRAFRAAERASLEEG